MMSSMLAITEAEIEEENGRLIYAFEIEVAGQDGVSDIEVDAITGELTGPDLEDEDAHDRADDDDGGSV